MKFPGHPSGNAIALFAAVCVSKAPPRCQPPSSFPLPKPEVRAKIVASTAQQPATHPKPFIIITHSPPNLAALLDTITITILKRHHHIIVGCLARNYDKPLIAINN